MVGIVKRYEAEAGKGTRSGTKLAGWLCTSP